MSLLTEFLQQLEDRIKEEVKSSPLWNDIECCEYGDSKRYDELVEKAVLEKMLENLFESDK